MILSMTNVTLAHVVSREHMGQQEYEARLALELEKITGCTVRRVAIGSLRARDADRRRPLGIASSLPFGAQALVGIGLYGKGSNLLHRLDARLPGKSGDVLTIHDVAPIRFLDEGTWPRHAVASGRRASRVIVPSRSTERDVRALGIDRITVIPYGVDPACFDSLPLSRADRERWGLQKYIVHAGGASTRKNLVGLADAWKRLLQAGTDRKLVLCGPEDGRRTTLFGHLPGTVLTGKLPRGQLLSVIKSAELVCVPSVYEGFGLPVLEAMACGVPVVAVAASSLPEVAGDVATLSGADGASIASAVMSALGRKEERKINAGRIRAAQFSWARTARLHLDTYERVLETRHARFRLLR